MKDSPFIYGSTVSLKSFTNREKEAGKLYNNLTSGINTMIISPRRWGKSSLVEKVTNDINRKEKKLKTLIIDLFSVAGEEEFLEVFALKVIKASSSRVEDWIKSGKDFFKQLIPKISLGIDPANDFSISFNWEELKDHKDEILNLPEIVAQKKGIKFIICLDEFQNLASFPDYSILEKKMRAAWQRHKNVTYCLYGSKRHMMSDIFNKPSKPFYRFGDLMWLHKINTDSWINFIVKGFTDTKKSINEADAKCIPSIMKNHSWYVQQLAHYTWQKTDKIAGKEEILAALNELIFANTPLYQKETESISKTQLNLLKAIVNGEKQLTSASVMNYYKLGTPRNVSKNKKTLSNNDLINEENGKYELLDPAFELWFLKQFFNQDYAVNFKV